MKLELTAKQKETLRQYVLWAEEASTSPTFTAAAKQRLRERALAYSKLLTIDNIHSNGIKHEMQKPF